MTKSDENIHMVEELAKLLSTECGVLDDSAYEINKRLAYHMLCCNNGWALELNPDGKESELYTYLLNNVCHGDRKAAITMKSYIYTREYAAKHGEWMTKDHPTEPTYIDIQDDAEKQDVSKILPNSDTAEVE